MRKIISVSAICTLLLCSCASVPDQWPKSATVLEPMNETNIHVIKGFKYSPTFTSLILPPGDYVPVKKDERGTYYAAPTKILISTLGGSFYTDGGIVRHTENCGMSVYYQLPGFGVTFQCLHSMWGLNLNEIVKCNPAYEFR